jgi:purine-nucleoside phosphorylase
MESAEKIRELTGISKFDVAVLGGSGIGFEGALTEIPYTEIPGMPTPKVPGHRGVLKVFEIEGIKLLLFEGRFHYYEGREDWEIRFIPELCHKLGVKIFIPTCASGAVSRRAAQSEIGVIYDHINLLGGNPLVGLVEEFDSKVFVNGKEFYSQKLVEAFLKTGIKLEIKIIPAVLAAMLGPNYETFSEIRMLELLGADCVSMSTVPEVITSRFLGMETVALTVFTNDVMSPKANHKEVLQISKERNPKLRKLIMETILDLRRRGEI